LEISNDADIPMKFSARFNSTDHVHAKPAGVELVLKPKSTESISVQFQGAAGQGHRNGALTADWTITYEFWVPPAEQGRYQW
jgi:hypothetical protein